MKAQEFCERLYEQKKSRVDKVISGPNVLELNDSLHDDSLRKLGNFIDIKGEDNAPNIVTGFSLFFGKNFISLYAHIAKKTRNESSYTVCKELYDKTKIIGHRDPNYYIWFLTVILHQQTPYLILDKAHKKYRGLFDVDAICIFLAPSKKDTNTRNPYKYDLTFSTQDSTPRTLEEICENNLKILEEKSGLFEYILDKLNKELEIKQAVLWQREFTPAFFSYPESSIKSRLIAYAKVAGKYPSEIYVLENFLNDDGTFKDSLFRLFMSEDSDFIAVVKKRISEIISEWKQYETTINHKNKVVTSLKAFIDSKNTSYEPTETVLGESPGLAT